MDSNAALSNIPAPEAVMLLSSIREVRGSNLGSNTDYPEGCHDLRQSLQVNNETALQVWSLTN
jgi:hypothetical protein